MSFEVGKKKIINSPVDVMGAAAFQFSPEVSFECLPPICMEQKGKKFGEKASTPLILTEMEVFVNINNLVSETVSIMTFYNDTNETLEGELSFPLPQRTSISGYGLDIDDVLVDAVPVSKEKARVAFEETVRKKSGKVSIAEKVDKHSNIFKTRVYPMKPKKTRTVKVVVLQKLKEDSTNLLYFCNLIKPKTLKKLKIHYDGNGEILLKNGKDIKACKTLGDVSSSNELDGFVIKLKKSSTDIQVEKDDIFGDVFFAANARIPVGEIERVEKKKTLEVKQASVFFDVSHSRRNANIEKEVNLLLKILKKFQNPKVEIVTFSHKLHEKKTFSKDEEIREYLMNVKFDGGTNIPLEEFPKVKSDILLLFSDGISNYGKDIESKLSKIKFGVPIYSISNSSKVSYMMLKYLGDKSGGNHFDLLKEKSEVIIEKIGDDVITLKNILYNEEEISEVYQTPIENNCISVFGIIKVEKAKVTLDFGSFQVTCDINCTGAKEKNLIRTLWAQQKIEKLSIFADKNKEEIKQLGIDYGIVSEHTSLIVLDSLQQYEKYKIVPPRQLKQIRKEYMNNITAAQSSEENRSQEKVNSIYKQWKNRVDWHKKNFTAPPIEPIKIKKKSMLNGLGLTSAISSESRSRCTGSSFMENFCCCRSCCDCDQSKEEEEEEEEDEEEGEDNFDDDDDDDGDDEKDKKPEMKIKKIKLKEKKKVSNEEESKSEIKVKAWDSSSPYLSNIRNEKNKYEAYLKEKKENEDKPSFYLDVADYFLSSLKNVDEGVRILSTVVELELGNPQLLRIIGYRLDQAGFLEEAIQVFTKVKKLRPEEPQSYRDLGLVYEKVGNYEEAAKLLFKVISGKWDSRFNQIELTAAVELNHVLFSVKDDKRKSEIMKLIDPRFAHHFDLDIRISMAWDTDMTDIDLHVYDMYGEHCYYSQKTTRSGGLYNHDFTRGYGPEEFMQKKVHKSGNFRITAKYYASHQQSLTGGTTILCSFYTNYMRENEKIDMVTVRLTENKDEIEVCNISFEKK